MKYNKIKLPVILISCSIAFAGCGSTQTTNESVEYSTVETNTDENIDDFKALVQQYNEDIMDETIFIGNMATYEMNYWKALDSVNGNIDSVEMVSKTYDWLKEKTETDKDTIEQNYKSIQKEYTDILSYNISGSEAETIVENLNELYTNFNSLYILVNSPSGTLSEFSLNASTYTQNIKNFNSILSTLVS